MASKNRFKFSMRPAMLAGAALLWCAGSASAATIFSDDFTRATSNTVGNSWTETESTASGASIFQTGAYAPPHQNNPFLMLSSTSAQAGFDAAAAQLSLSTVGLTNITLKFDWIGHNTDASPAGSLDNLTVQWQVAGAPDTWTTLATYNGNDGNGTNIWHDGVTLALGALASNTTVQIRFAAEFLPDSACTSSATSGNCEEFKIDNVLLAGDVSAIPLPPAAILFGTALVGLGVLGRRRKKDGVAQA